ncbi:hypothetical protein [Marinilactibacillus psychrotolerans]|uniref:hypothetical protein n=1 Tax=Marinilactibacillus psychrotolerans TaxID=191770 RepID=UPI0039AFD0FD
MEAMGYFIWPELWIFSCTILHIYSAIHTLYGFIEISDKKVIEKEFFDDEYQLQMRVGDVERVIVMNKSDRLTFGANLNSTEECEVQLENIWDKIETDEWYFMRVDKKIQSVITLK